jgi:hypothetical protein
MFEKAAAEVEVEEAGWAAMRPKSRWQTTTLA